MVHARINTIVTLWNDHWHSQVSDLKKLTQGKVDEKQLVDQLRDRSKACGAASPTECGLLQLRLKSFSEGASKDSVVQEGASRRLRLCDGDSLDLVDSKVCKESGT